MKYVAPFALALSLAAPVYAQEGTGGGSITVASGIGAVAPALQAYTESVIVGDLWQRPQLARRDRSIVTVAALIARGHTGDLDAELRRALANGVTPAEISEIVTHLAFYAGWGSALTAAPIVAEVFVANGITATDLPGADVELLPQNAEGEAARVESVAGLLGNASPGLADFTTDPLFSEIWLRPDLAPRDRSLVTITSLIALGQTGQLGGHLNRALDNGLTGEEAGEVVAHLAFYSGWPTAFSAGPVIRDVLTSRGQ
jgi:4-carboxymuconolactone decarboxylase